MEKVRLGIIGVGNMGSSHIKNALQGKMPEIDITKRDDLTFDIFIGGELMDSFDKLGKIQNKILESCNNEYKNFCLHHQIC